MSTLQYTVWYGTAEVANGPVLNENVISFTSPSVQSSTVMYADGGNRNVRVRIFSDADCWVTWGDNPTAVNDGTDGRMLGAENPEYFEIGADQKIAVIERT